MLLAPSQRGAAGTARRPRVRVPEAASLRGTSITLRGRLVSERALYGGSRQDSRSEVFAYSRMMKAEWQRKK